MKKIIIKASQVNLDLAHMAGGCKLPKEIEWPVDTNGRKLLHLATFPLNLFINESDKWISIFSPFDLNDTFSHWENLVPDNTNESAVIVHDNSGEDRNEFEVEISNAKAIEIYEDGIEDNEKNLSSKIWGVPVWLQDEDAIENHTCILSLNGNDIDIGFPEECGIFSDGIVYVFLNKNIKTDLYSHGKITFQFT